LAKVYSNLPESLIVADGCSRTDKRVHARGMVAPVYASKENNDTDSGYENKSLLSIDRSSDDMDVSDLGRESNEDGLFTNAQNRSATKSNIKTIYPVNATDPSFIPIPNKKRDHSNLRHQDGPYEAGHQMAYTLNRMLPDDIRIMAWAPVPTNATPYFHPTL
jgi:hypothetical protein